MLYLYYNKRHDAWSEITQMSYHLKLRSPRTEMSEGDQVIAMPRDVAKRLTHPKTPKRARKTKTRARRARKVTQEV